MKKVRCIDDISLLNVNFGGIYEVVHEDAFVYKLAGLESLYSRNRFEDVIEPQIPRKTISYKSDRGGSFESHSLEVPLEQTITWYAKDYEIKSLKQGELILVKRGAQNE